MFKKVIPAIIFGVVYAALILFGWGLDDVGAFFSHPARTILFGVTIGVNTVTMLFKDKFNYPVGIRSCPDFSFYCGSGAGGIDVGVDVVAHSEGREDASRGVWREVGGIL